VSRGIRGAPVSRTERGGGLGGPRCIGGSAAAPRDATGFGEVGKRVVVRAS